MWTWKKDGVVSGQPDAIEVTTSLPLPGSQALAHLARRMVVVCNAMLLQRRHCPVVRLIADMVCARAAAVHFLDQALVRRLGGCGLEDALGHGRAADVAEAHEEHRYWFGHGD